MNQRFSVVSTSLTRVLHAASQHIDPDPQELVDLWTSNNHARSCVVIGDPAVRLPLANDGTALPPT